MSFAKMISAFNERPYFLPLWTGSVPVWDWDAILMGYTDSGQPSRSFREKHGWERGKTLFMIESGGFAVEPPTTAHECMSNQIKTFPDIALTLDFPVKLRRPDKGRVLSEMEMYTKLTFNEKLRRLEKTIETAKEAVALRDEFCSFYETDFDLMGVLHGLDIPTLTWCTEEMYSFGYEIFGFGGTTTFSSGRELSKATENVMVVRDLIGKTPWLHLLGITDIEWLVRMRGLFESFDSAYISIQAKNAQLIFSDGSATYLSSKKGDVDTKYMPLIPKHRDSYFMLQYINFINYVRRLYRFKIITHGRERIKKTVELIRPFLEKYNLMSVIER